MSVVSTVVHALLKRLSHGQLDWFARRCVARAAAAGTAPNGNSR